MEFLCIALGRYARNNENLVLVFDTDGLVLAENLVRVTSMSGLAPALKSMSC